MHLLHFLIVKWFKTVPVLNRIHLPIYTEVNKFKDKADGVEESKHQAAVLKEEEEEEGEFEINTAEEEKVITDNAVKNLKGIESGDLKQEKNS